MAEPGDKKKRATYQDVLDAPDHVVAEIVNGELRLSPRPAARHQRAATVLTYALGPPFDEGDGGPGGWIFLAEPELHLGEDILVPDVAGWRRERFDASELGNAFIQMSPDWVCEVLSPRTMTDDRYEKLPIYAAAGVKHVWFVHPVRRAVEVMRLHEGKWLAVATHLGDVTARLEPFDAIELDLSRLWRDVPPPPSRASEAGTIEWSYEPL